MLNLRLYETEIDAIEPGQTIRINHTDCEAGEDTRRRLYLTRTLADEAAVVAYCHNCQQGGKRSDHGYKTYRNTKHGVVDKAPALSDTVEEPHGLVTELVDWPTDARAWAISRRLTQEHANYYGIAYDPSSDRVYLPKINGGLLQGYQLRAIHPWQRPKYLTANTIDAQPWTYLYGDCTTPPDYVVIVEDLISGIHIIDACSTDPEGGNVPDVYVLHGVKVDPTLMHRIANQFTWATIWLDNDNVHVCKQAELMERTIKLYNDNINVRVIKEENDPKHYSPEDIRMTLDEVWNG